MRKIGGIITPIITPMTPDQQVDRAALAGLCEKQVTAGIGAIFALGTTGEFYGLTHAQRREVVDIVVQSVRGRIPVIVGISGDSTTAAAENYRTCRHEGVAGYVASTPYFLTYTQDELVDHFHKLADVIGGPLILYNYPGRYRHRIEVLTVAKLAESKTISSIKDTAGDFAYMQELLAVKGRFPGLAVFESALPNLPQAAPLGIDGSVQALANLFPADFAAVWTSIERQDWPAVGGQTARLWDFHVAMENAAIFIASLKACMSARGWCGPTPAAPTRPVAATQLPYLNHLVKTFQPVE